MAKIWATYIKNKPQKGSLMKNSLTLRSFAVPFLILGFLAGLIYLYCQQQRLEQQLAEFENNRRTVSAQLATLVSDFYLTNDSIPEYIQFADKRIWLDEVTREKIWEKVLRFKSERWRWPILNYRLEKYSFVFDSLRSLKAPEDLKYVAVQESYLSARAVSWAQAKGFWQFIVSTAKKFGIKINWYIDERMDPAQATIAAVGFLNYLYEVFDGDWQLSIAAYNSGEAAILRSINKSNSRNYFGGLLHLPKETKEYLINILAWKLIMERDQAFVERFSRQLDFKITTMTVQVKVLRPLRVAQLLPAFDDSYEIFQELNPVFIQNIIPVGKFSLQVPQRNRKVFTDLIAAQHMTCSFDSTALIGKSER